jgi:hypothetical protein
VKELPFVLPLMWGENEVQELMPGNALIVKADGSYSIEAIVPPQEEKLAVLNVFISVVVATKKFIAKNSTRLQFK